MLNELFIVSGISFDVLYFSLLANKILVATMLYFFSGKQTSEMKSGLKMLELNYKQLVCFFLNITFYFLRSGCYEIYNSSLCS